MSRKILDQQPTLTGSDDVKFASLIEVFLSPGFRFLRKFSLGQVRTLIANNVIFMKDGEPDATDLITDTTRLCLNTQNNVLYLSVAGGSFVAAGAELRGAAATYDLIESRIQSYVQAEVGEEETARVLADTALSDRITAEAQARTQADAALAAGGVGGGTTYDFIDMVSEIPATPATGAVIEFIATLSSLTGLRNEDDTADVTSVAVGDIFKYNGSAWVRVHRGLTQALLYPIIKEIFHPADQMAVTADDTDHELDVATGSSSGPGGSFTPTKANLYSAVKAIFHPNDQSAVTADDAESELDISSAFTPSQANLYAAVKAILVHSGSTGASADDANNEIDIAAGSAFTPSQQNLYAAVKAILHPADQSAVSADDTNHELDIAGVGVQYTAVAALADIPSNPAGGDIIRFTAEVDVSSRSDVLADDASTAVINAKAHQEYRRVGSNWVRLTEEEESTLEEVGTANIDVTQSNQFKASGITPTADQLTDDTVWLVTVDASNIKASYVVSVKTWKTLNARTADSGTTGAGNALFNSAGATVLYLGRTNSNEILFGANAVSVDPMPLRVEVLRSGGGSGSSFTPTQSNLYDAVKAILHPADQSAVTADDANHELDIATGTGGGSDDIVDLSAGIRAATAADEGKIGIDAGGALYTVDRVHNAGTPPSGTETTITPQNTSNFRGVEGSDPANPVINQWYYNYYEHVVKLATEPGSYVIWVVITANFAGTNTVWLQEHDTLVDALRSIRNYSSTHTYYYYNAAEQVVKRVDTYVAPVSPHTDYRWQRVTTPLTQSSLYEGVKAILHPSDQTDVTADDANSQIDISVAKGPLVLPPPLQVISDKSEVTRKITETVNYSNATEDSFFIFSDEIQPHRGVGARVRLYNEVPNMNPVSNVVIGTQSPDSAKDGRDLFDAYYIDRGRQFRNEWKMAIGCEFTYAALSDDTDTPSAINDGDGSMGDNGQSIIAIGEKNISNTPEYYPLMMIDRRDSDTGQLYGVVASGTFFEASQVARHYLDIGGQKHSVVRGSAESTHSFTVPSNIAGQELGISFQLKDQHGYSINAPIIYLYNTNDGNDSTTIRLETANDQQFIKDLDITIAYTSPNLTLTIPALNQTGETYELDVSIFWAGAEQIRHRYATHTVKNYQNTVGPVDQTVPADVWHKLIMIFRSVAGNLVITPVIQMADGTKVQINVINTGRRIQDLDMSDLVFGDPAGVTVRNIQGFGIKSTVALDSLPTHTVLSDWIDNTGQVWDQITGTETLNVDVNLDFGIKGTGVIERITAAQTAAQTAAEASATAAIATAKEEAEAFAQAQGSLFVHWDGTTSPLGGLSWIEVTAGGSGYTTSSAVTITAHADDTDASGAAASVAAVSSGAITRFNVTNGGTQYTKPPTITVAGGTGGTFVAHVEPNDTNRAMISGTARADSWENANNRWRTNYRVSNSDRRVQTLIWQNSNIDWRKFSAHIDALQPPINNSDDNGAIAFGWGFPETPTAGWAGESNNGMALWINRDSTTRHLQCFFLINDFEYGALLGDAAGLFGDPAVCYILKTRGTDSIITLHNSATSPTFSLGGGNNRTVRMPVTGNATVDNAANRFKLRVVGSGKRIYVYVDGTLYIEAVFPLSLPSSMGPSFGVWGDGGQGAGLRTWLYECAVGSPDPADMMHGYN